MGTIKIELDLPNFEKELELKVVLNKDGVQSSTPSIRIDSPSTNDLSSWKQQPYPNPLVTCTKNTNPNSNSITGVGGEVVSTIAYGSQVSQPKEATLPNNSKIPSSMMGNY